VAPGNLDDAGLATPDPSTPIPPSKPITADTAETVAGDYKIKGAWRRGDQKSVRAAMRDPNAQGSTSKQFAANTVVGDY
jgi:hypothetical protein